MVPELHDMRIVCLLKAVTPAWVTKTVSFTFLIDYIHHSGSFEVLQVKVNVYYRSGLCFRSRVPLTDITPRVVDRLMYLSCILLRIAM